MISQDLLSFQYLSDTTETNLTSFAGLPLYLDLANVSGLSAAIDKHLTTKAQGWSDLQILMSLVMLNLAGGDCVEDIVRLENDEGLSMLLAHLQTHGMKRKERRAYEKRWRKTRERAFPSAPALRRYLDQFHHETEEKHRVKGEAFIPKPNAALQKLLTLNAALIRFMQQRQPHKQATLDQDATLAATHKGTALYCYKNYKAYQPFNTYWHEHGLLIHSEFRDGNVPAGYEQLRILQESIKQLPDGIEKVYLRSDSAGYQQDLLEYCARGKNERVGVIEFAIATRVSNAFKQAVSELPQSAWQPLIDGDGIDRGQEWAEVCYVPTWVGLSKKSPHYRYLAIRERMELQPDLPGVESAQLTLPFQTIELTSGHYKLFGVVTNRTVDGNELINWHRQRCGDSEKVHSVEKSELAGGQFPSRKFGANAAWWQIMVLAFNLNTLLKRLALPEALKTKAMKALRFHVIGIAGRVIKHARGLFIKLSGGLEVVETICKIRHRIAALVQSPPIFSTA